MPPRVVLASASPRRLELLRTIGLSPLPSPSGLEEVGNRSEPPRELVLRLAEAKGRQVAKRIALKAPGAVVLAADTGVVLDGVALGKPADAEEASEMLRRLSGRTHEVLTGVFVLRTDDGRHAGLVDLTRVRFRGYDEGTIRWYVASGEPMDKAGAYGIQGWGALLVDRIEGSWANVVGLPLERLPELFRRVGLDLLELAATPRS